MTTITVDTLELTRKLVEAGFTRQQAESVIIVMRDAQAELSSKDDLKELGLNLGWQIKGLYAMNAASIAGLIWLANLVLEALKHLPK